MAGIHPTVKVEEAFFFENGVSGKFPPLKRFGEVSGTALGQHATEGGHAMDKSFNRFAHGVGMVTIALILAPVVARSQEGRKAIANEALRTVADIPLPGPAVRFDYQSLDVEHGRLYIAHMNADQLVVFDTGKQQVVANLNGFKRVHGVLAVPEIGRVYASVTGEHHVVVVDMQSLKVIATAGPVTYPDGLAYVPSVKRVFVSDEHGGMDAVMDAASNKLILSIPLGGEAGNTVYDGVSGRILVAVSGVRELVAVDPVRMAIVGRYALPGIENPHGIALDAENHLAFVAGEKNHSLGIFDLSTMKLLSVQSVGEDPDVLAFDHVLRRLYVSAESGTVSVFQEEGKKLRPLAQFDMPHAHTVAIDAKSHLVYFPLENLDGRPVLRIMRAVTQP